MMRSDWTMLRASAVAALMLWPTLAYGQATLWIDKLTPGPHATEDSAQLLLPQIARQAVWLAAVDELEAAAVDAELAPIGAAPGEAAIRVDTTSIHHPGQRVAISIRAGEATIYEHTVDLSPDPLDDLAQAAGALSSQRPAIAEALRAAGVKPGTLEPADDTDDFAGAEALSQQLSIASQFMALRKLSAQPSGPRRVRVLANLAELTRHLWSLSSDVYAARALLLAEQAVARQADAGALATRGYARTFAGLHAAALADFDAARQQTSEGKALPDWARAAEAYCRFDHAELGRLIRDTGWDPLPVLLLVLVYEHQLDAENLQSIGLDASQELPACARLADLLSADPLMYDVVDGNGLLFAAPHAVARQLAALTIDGNPLRPAPGEVVENWNVLKENVRAIGRLTAADSADNAAPWPELGRLLYEASFKQAVRAWHPASVHRIGGYMELKPLFEAHPYGKLIPLAQLRVSVDAHREGDVEATLPMDVLPMSFEPHATIPYWRPRYNQDFVPRWPQAAKTIYQQCDDTGPDLAQRLAGAWRISYAFGRYEQPDTQIDEKLEAARRLLKISPHTPIGRATLIELDPALDAAAVDRMIQQSPSQMPLIAAAARRFYARRDWARALDMLTRLRVTVREAWVFEWMAQCQWRLGDDAAARRALGEARDAKVIDKKREETLRLEHALDAGRWQEARDLLEPRLAEQPDTWAATASRYYEGIGWRSQSEAWARRAAELVPGQAWRWHAWHLRHGKLNHRRALRQLKRMGLNPRREKGHAWQNVLALTLTGDAAKAAAAYEALAAREYVEPLVWMLAADTAGRAGDAAMRRRYLQRVVELGPGFRPGGPAPRTQPELIELAQQMIHAPESDAPAIAPSLPPLDPAHPLAAEVRYFAAAAMARAGQVQEAKPIMLELAREARSVSLVRTLACRWLIEQGVEAQSWLPHPHDSAALALTTSPDAPLQNWPIPDIRTPRRPETAPPIDRW